MFTPRKSLGVAGLLALVLMSPLVAAAPTPTRAVTPPVTASSFVGRLQGSTDSQAPIVDLGVITSIRYAFSGPNQGIAISATSNGKNNLCYIQFNAYKMSEKTPGWTRSEPVETYREIVAAARTPGGKILCTAPIHGGAQGSVARVTYDGTFHWVVLGGTSSHEFQIIEN